MRRTTFDKNSAKSWENATDVVRLTWMGIVDVIGVNTYMTSCDYWHFIIWVSRSTKVTWVHWPRVTSQWPIANRHTFIVWFPEVLNPNLWFIVPKNVPKPLLAHPLCQSSSFGQFEFWPLRRSQPAMLMPFYSGALRMLNVAMGYSNNTLSCSELNREYAGECFRSLRHILATLCVCKSKISFFAKIWPLTCPNEVKC